MSIVYLLDSFHSVRLVHLLAQYCNISIYPNHVLHINIAVIDIFKKKRVLQSSMSLGKGLDLTTESLEKSRLEVATDSSQHFNIGHARL